MQFTVESQDKDTHARVGQITLPSGEVETPAFMPVATYGAVRTLAPWELKEIGASIVLSNTYHLHIRPGEEEIEKLGGIQRWMSWNGPVLTDSGGYQAYSLSRELKLAKTTDDGVKFRSHLDGKKLLFTPEGVVDIQAKLGTDIMMVLDDCPPFPVSDKRLESSVKRTADWAKRSSAHWSEMKKADAKLAERALFGIVQGGIDERLRLRSLEDIQSLPFDGIAVGGMPLGGMSREDSKKETERVLQLLSDRLDPMRPHYLMGVGDPSDLIRYIALGVDMFDCVLPTRLGRHGGFWTHSLERGSLRQSKNAGKDAPLDSQCSCKICRQFTVGYLRHLYISGETLAARALSYHNLYVIFQLLEKIRASICAGSFESDFGRFIGVGESP